MTLLQFCIAAFSAATISYAALRTKSLNLSGALAAFLLGTIVFAIGGWSASILLVLFFVTGSLLSRLPSKSSNDEKEPPRNWKQVLANGWLPGIAMLVLYFRPDLREETTALFIGALATAAADTFATEFGVRYSKRAVSIATLQPIEKGLSGGVSLTGTLASILGALAITTGFYFSMPLGNLCELAGINWFLPLIFAGFVGALADSWLGATIQVKNRCSECDALTEKQIHCYRETEWARGFSWIDNNVVNAIATGVGGLIALHFIR